MKRLPAWASPGLSSVVPRSWRCGRSLWLVTATPSELGMSRPIATLAVFFHELPDRRLHGAPAARASCRSTFLSRLPCAWARRPVGGAQA